MAGAIAKAAGELAAPILLELGLELVDVNYVKEGSNWFLRFFIDSDAGVDLDTCEQVSERVGKLLDEQDLIKDAYFLDVSSAGAERPLKKLQDYVRAVGKDVHLTTYEPVDGAKVFEGRLSAADAEHVVVEVRDKQKVKQVTVPFEKIAGCRLAILF
ncbi:MAG: ribosome maturation factor RimP [Sporolactobacillus sp.]